MKKKYQPQSTQRPQNIFFQKTKNRNPGSLFHPLCVLPDLCGCWFFSPLGKKFFFLRIPREGRQEDERRGSRERRGLLMKTPWEFCASGKGRKGDRFLPFISGLEPLAIFTSVCSATSAVKFFIRISNLNQRQSGKKETGTGRLAYL